MSSIYFGQQSSIKKSIVSFFSRSLRIIAPNIAMKLARKVLLVPSKRQNKWPSHVERFSVPTRHGNMQAYKYGEGKSVWLIHGWSGSGYQFWPLMQKLADKGFCTITFDLPAHGFSDGKYSSLPKMIQSFDDISQSLFEPSLVITHSMGASVLANCQWFQKYDRDVMLIAPLLETYNLLQSAVDNTGFDQVLFNNIIDEVRKNENMDVPSLNAIPLFKNFSGNLKIIHDMTDKFAPLDISKILAKETGAQLHITDKLGHGRILRSQSVSDMAV